MAILHDALCWVCPGVRGQVSPTSLVVSIWQAAAVDDVISARLADRAVKDQAADRQTHPDCQEKQPKKE